PLSRLRAGHYLRQRQDDQSDRSLHGKGHAEASRREPSVLAGGLAGADLREEIPAGTQDNVWSTGHARDGNGAVDPGEPRPPEWRRAAREPALLAREGADRTHLDQVPLRREQQSTCVPRRGTRRRSRRRRADELRGDRGDEADQRPELPERLVCY